MKLLSRRAETKPTLIFDIGSASIGAAVVTYKNGVPHMEHCIRRQMPFREHPGEAHFTVHLTELLSALAKDVLQEAFVKKTAGSPSKIVCVLSSPWTTTETTTASFTHKERFTVNERTMDNLLLQVKDRKRPPKEDEVVIEEAVISSLLNGYPTQAPLGKTAQSITVTVLESSMSQNLHERITDALAGVFGMDIPLIVRSSTLVSFSVARDIFDEARDFLLVDVTSEVTEIAVVRNSTLKDTLSFPYGRNILIRALAEKTGSIPEDAFSRLKLHFKEPQGALIPLVQEEESRWKKYFGSACAELAASSPLPYQVILVASPEFEEWFTSLLERVDFGQFTSTNDTFRVTPLIRKDIELGCTVGDGVLRDPFLIIGALFSSKIRA